MNTQKESVNATITRAIHPGGSSPVTDKHFWGRDADLNALAGRARKAIHTLLLGPRRIGKTSLLRELQIRYKNEFIGLFLDLEGDVSPQAVIVKLAEAMRPYLKPQAKFLATLEAGWNTLASMIHVPAIIQLLETVNAGNWSQKGEALFAAMAELEKPVILCLDEIPIFINRLINDGQQPAAERFMYWLRGASDHPGRRVSVVLCGSIGFQLILERVNLSAAINNFTAYRLDPWEKETAVDFLRGVAHHDGLTYEDGAEVLLIDTLRCCIPHHVQLLHHELAEHCLRTGSTVISRELAVKACEQLINSEKGGPEFSHYVERLRSAHSEMVFKAACGILTETAREAPQRRERLERICRQQKLSEEETRMLLKCLTEDGYLEETEAGLRFISPLLQGWWKKKYVKRARNG